MTEPELIGGRYEIGDMLGHGGMATVYRGTDNQTQQAVAIKQLKPEIIRMDPDIVERFDREGEALRRLNHPNIVKVLATVEHQDVHYVVMELVSGGDLRSLLDDHRARSEMIPVQRVMEIALDLSDALARAHRLKITHRDLKPANVLMAEDGTPRLTDFGVAHFGDSTRMTQTGALIGTLAYLSPEVCMGYETDTRGDIWAFGVMLYEMLTLHRPFDQENSAALINAIMSKDPDAPDELRPDIPKPLSDLVMNMLAKDRDQRVSSVRFVGAQLEAMIFGHDLPDATPTSTPAVNIPEVSGEATPAWPNVPIGMDSGEFLPGEKAQSREKSTSTRPPSTTTTRRDSSTTTRILGRQPRVYISYRSEDSAAAAGRIHDRLNTAFGVRNVFKDADATLEMINEVDVLLAVIGPGWTTAQNLDGSHRLSDPNDRVRAEITAALDNPNVMVIPVLVNRAQMPTTAQLPAELHELAYRNSTTVRNDPEFNRDVEWLIGQIKGVAAAPQGALKRSNIVIAGLMLAILVMLAALAVVLDGRDDEATTNTQSAADPAAITLVDPVADGNYMVLIAELEQVGDEDRDVTRFIVDDLTRRFEVDVPFSDVEIRRTPDVVRSTQHAREVAEANTAAVIIWGSYDSEVVEVNVEVGSLAMIDNPAFSAADMTPVVNARVRMDDPRRESLIASVVAVLNGTVTIANDTFAVAQNLAILQIADPTHPEIIGNSAAANWHRDLQLYFSDPEAAVQAVTTSIQLTPHPLYYMGRQLSYQRLEETTLARQDANTAVQISPEGWYAPRIALAQHLYYFEDDLTGAIALMEDVISDGYEPTWFMNTFIGGMYVLQEDNDRAREFIEAAIAQDPPLNWPYIMGSTIALRQGRIRAASDLVDIARENYANPEFGLFLLQASYGSTATDNALTRSLDAFGFLLLSQWSTLLEATQSTIALGTDFYDLHLLEGLAHCNLGDYEAAEASYTTLIDLEPDYMMAYALRADVRLQQGNTIGALADGAALFNSEQADAFLPYADAIQTGAINCTNLLTLDLDTITADAGE